MQSGSIWQLITPLKSVAQRFAYAALMVLSVAIIILDKADVTLIERLRTTTDDIMAPILSVLSQPATAAAAALDRVHNMVAIYHENDRLRDENAQLMQWQQVARRLESENEALRRLTKYRVEGDTWYITAEVVGTGGGAYSRNVLLDRGHDDNVAKGQAAISGAGLVGRVAEVGARASRVLLLTDLNSRIPVTLAGSHDKAILAGDNTGQPVLIYLPQAAKVQVGDHVVTSGDGGVFPPGLAVGVVASVTGGQVRIEPSTDLSRIEYLRIVDFGLGGVLAPGAVPMPKPGRKGEAEALARP